MCYASSNFSRTLGRGEICTLRALFRDQEPEALVNLRPSWTLDLPSSPLLHDKGMYCEGPKYVLVEYDDNSSFPASQRRMHTRRSARNIYRHDTATGWQEAPRDQAQTRVRRL
jgi:hypothetical protein